MAVMARFGQSRLGWRGESVKLRRGEARRGPAGLGAARQSRQSRSGWYGGSRLGKARQSRLGRVWQGTKVMDGEAVRSRHCIASRGEAVKARSGTAGSGRDRCGVDRLGSRVP